MKKCMHEKEEKRKTAIAAAILIFFVLVCGCARESRSVRTETVGSPSGTQTVIVEKETVKTEGHSHTGILGGALHVVGEIIAFPFEVIAGAFRFIF